jgi:hypothetical protein
MGLALALIDHDRRFEDLNAGWLTLIGTSPVAISLLTRTGLLTRRADLGSLRGAEGGGRDQGGVERFVVEVTRREHVSAMRARVGPADGNR